MKTLQILFLCLCSATFVYGQESSDRVVINSDNFSDNQVWYLKANDSFERLDSASVKILKPNWIKSIEVKHTAAKELGSVDTIYIYIEIKKRKYKKYLSLIGHE